MSPFHQKVSEKSLSQMMFKVLSSVFLPVFQRRGGREGEREKGGKGGGGGVGRREEGKSGQSDQQQLLCVIRNGLGTGVLSN